MLTLIAKRRSKSYQESNEGGQENVKKKVGDGQGKENVNGKLKVK